MDIQGKTVLVTGASRGIGRAIALKLAQQGAQRILLVARDPQRLAEVAAEIAALGAEAVVLPLDLGQPLQVRTVLNLAWQEHGPIHLLVNSAGVAHQTAFLRSSLSQIRRELDINLVGLYTITRLVAQRMALQGEGTIVNVSSLMGKVAAPTMATYSATKYAILGFTQALRQELAGHNIRVVALLPSLTHTDMVRDMQQFRWVVPMTPERVADALVKGLRRNGPEIVVGWQGVLVIWCNRLFPKLVEQLIALASPSAKPFPDRIRLNAFQFLWFRGLRTMLRE
jgi:3-oxoacyl-[acyl-carrier protein] reductase